MLTHTAASRVAAGSCFRQNLAVLMVQLIAACPLILFADEPPQAAKEAPAAKVEKSQEELEAAFAKLLTGATLEGGFTMDSPEQGSTEAKPERYRLKKVAKHKDDVWLFQAGVAYAGKQEVVVPIYLTVKWAGDTPVITLTDLNIPLLGTYTARVLFHEGRYAGTWSGGGHGGELFGRITHPADTAEGEAAEVPAADAAAPSQGK